MTVVVEKVRRVRIFRETTFATEQAIASFIDLKFREDAFKMMLERPQESPLLQQQHIYGYPTKVFGPKKASIDVTVNLAGTHFFGSQTADNAYLWNALFGAGLGNTTARTDTTAAAGSTVSAVEVASATGAYEGGCIVCVTGSGGSLEAREIKTVSGTTITPKLQFSSAASNGSAVYFTPSFGMQQTTAFTAQFAVEGMGQDDRWLLLGGAPKSPPTFTFSIGQIPTMATSFECVDWYYADGVNTTMDLTGTSLSDQDYENTGINVVMDSELRIQTVGTSTLTSTLIDCSELKIQPNIKFVAQKTPAGINTVKQWVEVRPDGPPVTAEFVVPYEGTTWFDKRDSQTALAVTFQVGSSSTNGGFLMTCPNMLIDDVQREETDGIASQRVKLYGRLDSDTTTNSSDVEKAPFRAHFW